MIFKLRNRHFYTWIVLAILLPLGFWLAWCAIPQERFGEVISHQMPASNNIVELADDTWVKVNVLKNAPKPGLEITLKQALRVPAALLYLSKDGGEDITTAQLLGKLDSRNSYYFGTEMKVAQSWLLLYDPINKVVFHKVAL